MEQYEIKLKKQNKIDTQLIKCFQFCFYLIKTQNTKKAKNFNILGVYDPPERSHDPSQTANLVFENS
jgi:hypothetical protein